MPAHVAAPCSAVIPIRISPTPCSSCRQLYEAVLEVERRGGAVVERRLSLVDAVLSPSAGLVICDNASSRLVGVGAGGWHATVHHTYGHATRRAL